MFIKIIRPVQKLQNTRYQNVYRKNSKRVEWQLLSFRKIEFSVETQNKISHMNFIYKIIIYFQIKNEKWQ